MKDLDESKYSVEWIFENQKASFESERLFLLFHETLVKQLNQINFRWYARTHKFGAGYFYGRKAFVWVNVYQKFISIKCFTGHSTIKGLGKANWIRGNDRVGSETYRIENKEDLKNAVVYSLEAYRITIDWVGETP